jgi:hypothetical protein
VADFLNIKQNKVLASFAIARLGNAGGSARCYNIS